MEAKLAADLTLNKEYLPVLGLETCASAATAMLLGEDNPAIREGRVSLIFLLFTHRPLCKEAIYCPGSPNKNIIPPETTH